MPSVSSRMSSTPVREAASISITSTWRSSAIERQCSHTPQGATVGPPAPSGPMQLSARAMIRAVVVLPTPRTPVRMKACAIRPRRDRVRQRAHHRLLADQLGEGLRPVFAGEHAIMGRGFGHRALSRRWKSGWETGRTTQAETRYGCFLPDLTGLARDLSIADLPPHYIRCRRGRGKFRAMLPRPATLKLRIGSGGGHAAKLCGERSCGADAGRAGADLAGVRRRHAEARRHPDLHDPGRLRRRASTAIARTPSRRSTRWRRSTAC